MADDAVPSPYRLLVIIGALAVAVAVVIRMLDDMSGMDVADQIVLLLEVLGGLALSLGLILGGALVSGHAGVRVAAVIGGAFLLLNGNVF